MNVLKRILPQRIAKKMLALNMAWMIYSALVCAVGMIGMHLANNDLKLMYSDRVEKLGILSEMNQLLPRQRADILNAVISAERGSAEGIEKHIGKALKKIDEIEKLSKQLDGFGERLSAEERAIIGEFVRTRTEYFGDIRQASSLTQLSQINELIDVSMNHVEKSYPSARDAIDTLNRFEISAANTQYEAAVARFEQYAIYMLAAWLVMNGLLHFMGAYIGRTISVGVKSIVDLMHQAARLDFSGKVAFDRNSLNEVEQINTSYSDLQDRVRESIMGVLGAASDVEERARMIEASIREMKNAAHAQSDAAASVAASIEEVTVSADSVATGVKEVSEIAHQSMSRTREGHRGVEGMMIEIGNVETAVERMGTSISNFVNQVHEISNMNAQVKEIAEQTNLLALNAAIEAARAGDQGRGFAVVADEVRKLAAKSSVSANQIQDIAAELDRQSTFVDESIRLGVTALHDVQMHTSQLSLVLTSAEDAVIRTESGIGDARSSIDEQSSALNSIASNMEEIAQAAEESAATTEHIHDNIQGVMAAVNTLSGMSSRFKFF